jgi:hypothetical protein
VLKAWDNVDGLFAEYVTGAYRDYFAHQSRFVLQEISKSDQVLSTSKVPYKRLIEDPQVLAQIARSARVETLVRTRVTKEGPQYEFKLEWLLAPNMRLLASDSFVMKDLNSSGGMADLHTLLVKALQRLIDKVPYVASITGRDGNSVTVNIGGNLDLKRGDTLSVATLDEVKEHPLLHSIVGWRLTPTGKLEVDQVEESIAFAHVTEEDPNRQVARDQKITQVIPRPPTVESRHDDDDKSPMEELPKLGYVAGGLSLGGFSRDKSSATGTFAYTGSGSHVGADAEGQLWFNRNIFADLSLRYGILGYTQKRTTGAASLSDFDTNGSATAVKIDAGYSYLLTNDFFGPKGWVKLGFHSYSYSLPNLASTGATAAQNTAESLSPISFKSVFVGIGADVPVYENFGGILDLNFGLFTGATETSNLSGSVTSASDGFFFIGGYYRYTRRITFRAGLSIQANGAEFDSGASLSQKIISFSPSLLYYF